jgi:uncharacterized membrane protein
MTPARHPLEHWVHRTLTGGVVVSGVLLLLGLVLTLAHDEPRPAGPPPGLGAVLRGVAHGEGLALIYLGLLALVATPVLRVAVLALGWLVLGPRWLAGVALVVLGLLVVGIVLGTG